MIPYIDIHTHQIIADSSILQVFNQIIGQQDVSNSIKTNGIHPWYINQDLKQQLALLEHYAKQPNSIAIGECGLDKLASTNWEVQIEAFKEQILLANRLNKPLVIHCVKAYEEVFQQLKQFQVAVPVFFHGVNKKNTLIESLVKKGYYVGLGAFILHGRHDDLIAKIDLTKIFLETDDQSISIVDIYSYFSRIRKISIEQLKEQLVQNFEEVFNYKII